MLNQRYGQRIMKKSEPVEMLRYCQRRLKKLEVQVDDMRQALAHNRSEAEHLVSLVAELYAIRGEDKEIGRICQLARIGLSRMLGHVVLE